MTVIVTEYYNKLDVLLCNAWHISIMSAADAARYISIVNYLYFEEYTM